MKYNRKRGGVDQKVDKCGQGEGSESMWTSTKNIELCM